MPPNRTKQPRKPRERKTSAPKTEDKSPNEAAASEQVGRTERNAPAPIAQQELVQQFVPESVQNERLNLTDHTIISVEQDPLIDRQQEGQQEQKNEHVISAPPAVVQDSFQMNIQEPQAQSADSSSGMDDDVFDEAAMSATLTRLTAPNGAEIYLIGTAHFSIQSVQDVRKVIRSTKPTSVILELCRERALVLTLDEQYLFELNSKLSFQTLRQIIAEKGLVEGLIYALFVRMSASLTEKLGMAPGAEFRAGSAEAQKIPGCNVVLADRSLRTTMARAVVALSLWQKMKLTYMALKSDLKITQEEVEKCKDRNLLEQLMLELGGQFPGFKQVILDERDVYLSHSIFKWALNCETSHGPPRIVAIMGIGHVPGIVANWGKTTDEQIRDLNMIPKTSRSELVVRKTVKYGVVALVLYVGYCCLVPSSVQNSVSRKFFGGY